MQNSKAWEMTESQFEVCKAYLEKEFSVEPQQLLGDEFDLAHGGDSLHVRYQPGALTVQVIKHETLHFPSIIISKIDGLITAALRA